MIQSQQYFNSPVISIIDTSYLEFPGLTKQTFENLNVPQKGLTHFSNATSNHIRALTNDLRFGRLCVPSAVIVEMSYRLKYFDGRISHLQETGLPQFSDALTIQKSSYLEFFKAAQIIERTRSNYGGPSLDPSNWLHGENKKRYERLLDLVREVNPHLYDNNYDGKYHSEVSRRLETDRRVAAEAIFFSQFRPVTVLTNDSDITNLILETTAALQNKSFLIDRHPITKKKCTQHYDYPTKPEELIPEIKHDENVVAFPTQKSAQTRVA